MRIGIMTFHWGTNYGGVLQAYSLQEFLKKMGHSVEIINYAPYTHRDSILECFKTKKPKRVFELLIEYLKEKKFVPFRDKYLSQTKRYFTLAELQSNPPDFDVYICGSDQVWNPYVAKSYGEPYFLSFGNDMVKRVSYAVSLGCTNYPSETLEYVKPMIRKFNKLSVRENSALSIIKSIGIDNVELMPDPTLLLEKSDLDLLDLKPSKEKDFYFFYTLQDNQVLIDKLSDFLVKRKSERIKSTKKIRNSQLSIEEWLSSIKNAKYVVTNSFHGAVFSILFQKQFIVIPIEGQLEGMNDRIFTLMNKFNLNERIFSEYNEELFLDKLEKPIDWVNIANIKKELVDHSKLFLEKL